MENISPESLLRKAQVLGDDIRGMEPIDVLGTCYQAQAKVKTNRRKSMYNQLMCYVAFLAIPLFLSSLVLGCLYFSEAETDGKYVEVVTAASFIIRYELSDHPVVWLSAGSTLRYPTTFKKDNRLVKLKGETYFEAQADKDRPFYVNAPNGLSVCAYGTKFNVATYEDDNYIETALEEGKVNVITPDQETIILALGEQLLYDEQSQRSKKNKVGVYRKIAWKNGRLIFRNALLEEVLKRLERHFNVEIQLNNRSGEEYKCQTTFRTETLPQISDYLARSVDLRWKIEGPQQQADDILSKTKVRVDLYQNSDPQNKSPWNNTRE